MKVLLLSIILALVTACAGVAVYTDYDTAYDFSSVKTYAWLKPKAKLIHDPFVDNDLMYQRMVKSVDSVMASRLLQKVEDEAQADVLISYHLSSHQKLSVSSYHNHFGYYPCRYCYPGGAYHHGSDISVRQYRAGSFIIDVVDPEKRDLVWRGVSERRLPKAVTPQERDLFINETVDNILAKLPIN